MFNNKCFVNKTILLFQMRTVSMADFTESLKRIRKSVASQSLSFYNQWNSEFGDVTI